MTAINYQFIPTPTATVQGATQIPRIYSPIFTVIIGRMRIDGWRLNKKDICTQCQISIATLQRALKWLVAHGYMAYDLIKKWQVYPVPVTPPTKITAKAHADNKASNSATSTPSPITNDTPSPIIGDTPYKEASFSKIEKQQPTSATTLTAEPMGNDPVVVFIEKEELVFPAQLTPDQKKAAKSIIKKVKQPELAQEVLFALAYAITNGNIKSSVPGYLNSLVTAANNGTFIAVKAAGATKPDNPNIAKADKELEYRRQLSEIKPQPGRLSAIWRGAL